MTSKEALQEFESRLDSPQSTVIALELVQGCIGWIDWIAEREYSPADHAKVIKACARFYKDIRPITTKYIDGEDQ